MFPKLMVFDLDGTLCISPEFYRKIYSGTLSLLVEKERGDKGLETLLNCRQNYDGKGELALMALNIPFQRWAELLITAPLESVQPAPILVEKLRKLPIKKAIYTGSPRKMAINILLQLGFNPAQDFDLIIGQAEPEVFPTKWTCSPLVFQGILDRFCVLPQNALAIGDTWDTDLMPAQQLGIKTVGIRKQGGNPDYWYPTVEEFLDGLHNL